MCYPNEKNDVGLEMVNGAFDLQAGAQILGINGDQADTPVATAGSKAAALITRASWGSILIIKLIHVGTHLLVLYWEGREYDRARLCC
jgi:hypothetical protein